jgi:putative endonuclease
MSFGWQAMYYTYILESTIKHSEHYIGHTSDLKERLLIHNNGKSPHTAKFRPWKVKLYIAFEKLEQAKKFEIYLKSGSGHAFANKHFW